MTAAVRIGVITVRELLYEKVVYLLVSFGLLSLGISVLLGQLTYTEQAKLTLDFMLGGIQLSMILFSVFMGISLFHRELQTGSISMVLSKPVSRTSFLIGKYGGQVFVQAGVTLCMALITAAITARFGEETLSVKAVLQTSFLIFLESACVTAITYFFAVVAGALTAAVATLCVLVVSHLRDPITKHLIDPGETSIWSVLRSLLPDLELFNMKALASYGFAVPWPDIGWLTLYAACCVTYFLVMAAVCFHRRDILT